MAFSPQVKLCNKIKRFSRLQEVLMQRPENIGQRQILGGSMLCRELVESAPFGLIFLRAYSRATGQMGTRFPRKGITVISLSMLREDAEHKEAYICDALVEAKAVLVLHGFAKMPQAVDI